MKTMEENRPAAAEEEGTQLPLFRSWRAVYAFVLGCFVLEVLLLAWLSRAFS